MLVQMKVSGLTIDPQTNAPIVILKDLDEKNALPVWIGVLEASAIATELEKVQFSRPMTHDLLREILRAVNVSVTKVVLNDLKDNVYYACIHIDSVAGARMVDARPSDAIALALRTSAPIFVDTAVLDKSKALDAKPSKRGEEPADDLSRLLEDLSPDEFGKYKM